MNFKYLVGKVDGKLICGGGLRTFHFSQDKADKTYVQNMDSGDELEVRSFLRKGRQGWLRMVFFFILSSSDAHL